MKEIDLEKLFRDASADELSRFPISHPLRTPKCPPTPRFYQGARHGWSEADRSHVTSCEFCQRSTALEWRIECPRLWTLAQYVVDGDAFQDLTAMRRHLEQDGCRRCASALRSLFVRALAVLLRARVRVLAEQVYSLVRAAVAFAILLLLVGVVIQTARVRRLTDQLARITTEAGVSQNRVAKLETEISRLRQSPIAEAPPLIARLDLSLPSGTLGISEPKLQRRSVPAHFDSLELIVHKLPESTGGLEATVEGATRPISRKLVITRTTKDTSTKLRLTSEDLGPFLNDAKTITISLIEPGHALVGRIELRLEKAIITN